MEKGKDIIQGGATINSSGATIIGLADVVDSLSALQKWVFTEKAVSFLSLLDALQKNFEGEEALRQLLMNPPKRRGTAMKPRRGYSRGQARQHAR